MTQEQIDALIQIVNNSSFSGAQVEFVAELKRTLAKLLEESKALKNN